MKLITKITLGAAALFLLFSQLFSLWNLGETKAELLEAVTSYESQQFWEDTRAFSRAMRGLGQTGAYSEEMKRVTVISQFRDNYDMNSALYLSGEPEALYNLTPYEFSEEEWRKEQAAKEKLPTAYYDLQGVLRETGGKKPLLLDTTESIEGELYWIVHYKDITEFYEKLDQIFLRGLLAALLLLALFLGLLYGVLKGILKPFYRLRAAAEEMTRGDYGIRVWDCGPDEVGEVARSFNQMAESVENQMEELTRTNERQQQLLGSLAHEIKTPMMSLLGYTQSLRHLALSEEQREKALSYLESECKRLSRLSAKMMELTGLYQADGELEMEPLSVGELLRWVEALSYGRRRQKEIALEVEAEPEASCVGDRDLLGSLLLNLIDNACKASAPGQRVCLRGGAWGFSVEDEGCGIPPEELSRVTEAFYMVDKARSRKEGGAGLGLAICREIAAAHQARLTIESEPGKGTRVSLLWEQI